MWVASYDLAGRASDIFSLGCIFLEILTFDQDGSLLRLKPVRPGSNAAYYENLKSIDNWVTFPKETDTVRHHLGLEVRNMLSMYPEQRPNAEVLLSRLRSCQEATSAVQDPISGQCCQTPMPARLDPQPRGAQTIQAQLEDWITEQHLSHNEMTTGGDEEAMAVAPPRQADKMATLQLARPIKTESMCNTAVPAQPWFFETFSNPTEPERNERALESFQDKVSNAWHTLILTTYLHV